LTTDPPQFGAFTYQDITVYPPYAGETPEDLVGEPGNDDLVRVAKLDDRVVGAYRLVRTCETHFEIRALAVRVEHRRRGIGRWLLGHAIGIAELNGARIVEAPLAATGMFAKVGFRPHGPGLRLHLRPE